MADRDPQAPLREFRKSNDFFVGVDSDGCAFDTMEVKHKECFIPKIVEHYGLAAVSKYARESAEFVNLYSKWRGINRFPGLILALDFLEDRPEVARRGFQVPKLPGLREWLDRESKPANPQLKAAVESGGDPDLTLTLKWSEDVNRAIAATVRDVPPFPLVRESLEALAGRADVMVVSATPVEALTREWTEHDLAQYVGLIAGQELGGKREHLALAAGPDRYDRDKVLMLGDAPGDLKAALENDALFFPIDPGFEEDSWRRFHDEAIPKFFDGSYRGSYMDAQIARFEELLPSEPPWK